MITKATLRDIPALNILINSAYRGESSKKGWTTEANILEGLRTNEEELTSILKNNSNTILKYTQENKILACVLLIEKKEHLYLGMLSVSPELQNSGIGKKLLFKAEVLAKKLNLNAILMTVISLRHELINWYKRHGYIETGATQEFPTSPLFTTKTAEPLEFIVLQKNLN